MKFFRSPVELIKLIMSAPATVSQINDYQKQTSAWYMGEEGKDAYKKATTSTAKMRFFQSYLNTIKKEGTDREIVALAAYVITCGIDGTSLPFAIFPNILDPKENPIVRILSEKSFPINKRMECGVEMLNALLGGSDSEVADWYNPEKRAYERLETCSDGHNPSDMYRLQRYIIGAFCCSDDTMQAPYVYDIVSSAQIKGNNNDNDE